MRLTFTFIAVAILHVGAFSFSPSNNDPNITVTIDPAGPFCESDPAYSLTATPPGGTWGGEANSFGQFIPPSSGVGSHIVTYTYDDGNGCTGTDQITIIVNANPMVLISPAGPFCDNDPVYTLTGTPAGGVWTGAANSLGEVDPMALGGGSHPVTYTYTDGNGCSGIGQLTVAIFYAPTASITPIGPFCEDAPVQTLTGTPTGGAWGGAANASGQIDPAILGAGTHNVTYTVTDGNNCSDTDQISVVIHALPNVSITPAGPFCVDDGTQTLSASPVGGTWGGAANASGQIDPATLGAGTHTVSYSYTDSNNCSNTDQISVTINALPTVSITPAGPFCDNDPVQTLSAIPVGGTWGGAANASGQIDPTSLGAGTHTITYDYTDGNGCSNSDQISVTINTSPTVSITPAGPFCDNDPMQTLSASPSGGTWGGAANASGQIDPTSLGAGTHTVTYSYTDSNNCTNSDQITITINASPTVNITPAGPFCIDDGIQTISASPFGGVWGGVANVTGEIDPFILGAGTHTVTYDYTDGNNCSNSDQITITINALPTVSITPAGPFCDNDPVQTLSASPTGGTWGGAANPSGQIDPTTLGAGSHTVTYDYTDGNNCSNSDQITITINAFPTVTITPAGPFCVDASLQTLSANPVGGTWGGAANASGQIDPTTLGAGSHTVTYDYTDGNNCSNSDQITITINALPTISISPAGPFCESASVQTLSASPNGGTWGGAANSSGQIDPTTLGTGSHNVTYNFTDSNGCTNSDQITVIINADPTVTISPAGPFCENQPTQTLSATPSGGVWGGAANVAGQIDPMSLGTGSHTVTYDYTDGNGCSGSDQIIVVVNAAPTVSISPVGPFCTDAPVQTLTGNPSGGIWGGVANSSGQVDPSTLGPGTHTVTYDYTDGNGCTSATSTTIEVFDLPTASISGSGIICAGSGATIDLTINLTGAFDITLTYAIDGTPQTPITISSSPYTLSGNTPGTYTITNITDANGCSNTGTGSGSITEVDAPTVSNINTNCDASNLNYTVTFEISGGDPSTYTVTGGAGTLSAAPPYIFTSAPIPSGTAYSFTINDANNCDPQTISGNFECSCMTQVGTMDLTPITGCGPSTVTTTYNAATEVNDGNDIVQFVIHTNSGTSLGTVLLTNGSPTFSFDPNSMSFGVTYYISAIMGNDDGTGNVDLSDPCLSVAQGTPVTFFEEPTADIGTNVAVCEGEMATLTITLTGMAPWDIVYNDGVQNIPVNGIASSPYTIDVNPTTTTTYTLVSVQDQNCPGTVTGSATVTINPNPTITINPAGPFCEEDPVQTLSATPAGGVWGGAANSLGEIDPSALGAGTHTVTYDYTDANGCSGSGQLSIVINAGPTASITPAGPFCEDDPVQTLSGTPAGGTWGGAANNLGEIDPTVLGTGSHAVSYAYTDANGCSDEDQINIEITALPTVSIQPAGPFCEEDPLQTLSGTPAGGTWGGVANANGEIDPAVLGVGAHAVTYDYTDANGCSNSDQTTIEITAQPNVSISPAGPFCEDDPVQTLIGSPAGGTWGGAANPSGQVDPSILGSGTFTVTYAYEDTNGCESTDQIDILINALPTITIAPAGPFCETEPTQTMSATPTGGTWGGAANAFGQISPSTLGAGSHIVTYNYTNNDGCSHTEQYTVIINATPNLTIDPAGPFCENDPIVGLTANPPGGIWGGAAGPGGSFNPNALGPGTHTVTYFYISPENCSNTTQASIVVNSNPVVEILPAGPFCENEAVQTLIANPPNGLWGGAADPFGQINPSTVGSGVHLVTYEFTNAEGCQESDFIPIEIFEVPTADISGFGTVCIGSNETVALSINTTGTGNITVYYEIDNNPQAPLTITSSPYILQASTPGAYTITQVIDDNNCIGTGTGMAQIMGNDAPTINNLSISCDATNTTYTVAFNISGGDPASYAVFGDPGILISIPPYEFTSNPIPSGDPYSFTITDANDCDPINLSGSFSCNCTTDAGTMDMSDIAVCEDDTAVAVHDDNENLDGNDNLFFVLHDGSLNTLGNVYATNDVPEFDFQAPLQYGVYYYISAVAGDDDGNGGVVLTDPCLSVSLGTPVVFNPIPTATLTNDVSICEGETTNLVLNLTGNAPFDLVYNDGSDDITLNTIFDGHIIPVNPSITTTYSIVSISDNSSPTCAAQSGNSVTVTVNNPETVFQEMEICDGESAFLQGGFQTQGGTYYDTLATIHNCDSIIVTDLIIHPLGNTVLNTTSCDPNSVGTFTNTYTNQNGCDSLVTEIVILVEADTTYQFETSCDIGNVGTSTQTFTNTQGCDSLLITITTFAESDTTYFDFTTCDPNEAGVVTQSFINSEGCDSLTITTTALLQSDTIYLSSNTCDANQAGVFSSLLINQNGCDSLVIETIDFLESDTTYLYDATCDLQNTGVFQTLLQNQNGCDSLVIQTVDYLASDTTYLNFESCDPQDIGVFTTLLSNAEGCDSLIIETVSFLVADTTYLYSSTCDAQNVGVFSTFLTNQDGCDSLILETVSLLASDTTELFSNSCDPNAVGVFTNLLANQDGCDSLVIETISLLASDTTYLYLDSCNPLDTGTVSSLLANQNGCDSLILEITALLPPASCEVVAFSTGDQIGCEETFGEITLTVEVGLAPFQYFWSNGNNSGNGTIQATNIPEIINNLQSGIYNITITASNGLETIIQEEITQIFPPEINLQSLIDYAGYDVSCFGEQDGSAQVNITNGGMAPFSYVWSNGGIANFAENLGAGWHFVTVTDANNCQAIDSILLTEPEAFQVNFSITDLGCFNDQSGAITVEAVGGVSPYLYSINGAPFQDNPTFPNLGAGNYTIVVQDANACEVSEIILVNTPLELQVELIGEEAIILGESAEIQILANVPFSEIDSIMWFPENQFECPNCIDQVVFPIITTTYSVMIIGENGCMAEDEITIFVERQRPIYIPNAFSPNGDGQNDFFVIHAGPQVAEIKSFLVFDRWGEPMYEAENFQPNDPAHGWDGTFRNQPLKSAVFVYFAEVAFIDGQVELFEGDVVLMR